MHTKEVRRSEFRPDGCDFWMPPKLKKEKKCVTNYGIA